MSAEVGLGERYREGGVGGEVEGGVSFSPVSGRGVSYMRRGGLGARKHTSLPLY